jgi:hypothetical protein
MNHALTTAAVAADTIANHHHRQRWEDGTADYMLGMLLTDLLVFARVRGIDFDAELATARDTLTDVYDETDLLPALVDAAMPTPTTDHVITLLTDLAEVIDTTNPDSDLYLDSGADTVQALCEHEAELRAVLASLQAAR